MIENVDPATLNAHPDNPRRGNIDAIAESIRTNGWWGVIVAQTSTRRVLAGNHRLEAAKRLNMTSVPVHWLDVDDHAARRILLADNRAADLAAYDDATLAAVERKRLSLQGVLVPLTAKWNEDALARAGFRSVEPIWRCLNFAAWIAKP